jgi:PHD/YefM family antitoxin component YafN of YafNO toxin-antitoxin module
MESGASMSLVSVQDIKRRGMSAIDEDLKKGPVHLVRSNRAEYVVMSERDYSALMADLAEARMAASENDLKAGRVRRGSADTLMQELADID